MNWNCFFGQLTRPQRFGCYVAGAAIGTSPFVFAYYKGESIENFIGYVINRPPMKSFGDKLETSLEKSLENYDTDKLIDFLHSPTMCCISVIGIGCFVSGLIDEYQTCKKVWKSNPTCCKIMITGSRNIIMTSFCAGGIFYFCSIISRIYYVKSRKKF